MSDGPNGAKGPVGTPSGPGPGRQNAVRRLALGPGGEKRLRRDASPPIGAENRPRSGRWSPTLAIKRKGRTARPSQKSPGVGIKPFYFVFHTPAKNHEIRQHPPLDIHGGRRGSAFPREYPKGGWSLAHGFSVGYLGCVSHRKCPYGCSKGHGNDPTGLQRPMEIPVWYVKRGSYPWFLLQLTMQFLIFRFFTSYVKSTRKLPWMMVRRNISGEKPI